MQMTHQYPNRQAMLTDVWNQIQGHIFLNNTNENMVSPIQNILFHKSQVALKLKENQRNILDKTKEKKSSKYCNR